MAEKIGNFYGSGYKRSKREGVGNGKCGEENESVSFPNQLRDDLNDSSSSSSSLPKRSRPSSKFLSLLQRAESKEREFKSKRLVDDFTSSIDNFRHWRVFDRQESGFEDIAKSNRSDLHLFSFESACEVDAKGNARRKFLVTSYDEFWHYYRQLPPGKRHFYEIIGENDVCKMYFDIEFPTAGNDNKDPGLLMDAFFGALCPYIEHDLGVRVERKDFLDLDSSTTNKFSRHVILARPGNLVFLNNRHLGRFVATFMEQVEKERKRKGEGNHEKAVEVNEEGVKTEPDLIGNGSSVVNGSTSDSEPKMPFHFDDSVLEILDELFYDMEHRSEEDESGLNNDTSHHLSSQENSIVDKGVYTKNRAFRLFLSSKAAKRQPLVIARDNLFIESITASYEIMEFVKESKADAENKSADLLKLTFFASMICNVNPDDSAKVVSYDLLPNGKGDLARPHSSSSFLPNSPTHPSPYPQIDAYILSHVIVDLTSICQSGYESTNQGSIRRSAFYSDRKIIVYDIKDYRFCRRVGRHHNSNNIQIVVNVVVGTWYQRCLDPDCSGFRSNEFPIPKTILDHSASSNSIDDNSAHLKEEDACLFGEMEGLSGEEDNLDNEIDDDSLFAEVVKSEGSLEMSKASSDLAGKGLPTDDFSSDDESFLSATNQADDDYCVENLPLQTCQTHSISDGNDQFSDDDIDFSEAAASCSSTYDTR